MSSALVFDMSTCTIHGQKATNTLVHERDKANVSLTDYHPKESTVQPTVAAMTTGIGIQHVFILLLLTNTIIKPVKNRWEFMIESLPCPSLCPRAQHLSGSMFILYTSLRAEFLDVLGITDK